MVSSLLAKKARLVQEMAGRLCEHLDPPYRDSLVRCLGRLDILSLRYLASQNHQVRVVPHEVSLVSDPARPFGWAVWLSILTDTKLDDPDWILGGLLKGSEGWGFNQNEARQWRSEYIRAHLAPAAPAQHPARRPGEPLAGAGARAALEPSIQKLG